MKNDLTIAKIKHTDFAELYDKFIIGKKLNQKQYETLLAIAICFLLQEGFVMKMVCEMIIEIIFLNTI